MHTAEVDTCMISPEIDSVYNDEICLKNAGATHSAAVQDILRANEQLSNTDMQIISSIYILGGGGGGEPSPPLPKMINISMCINN